MVSAHSTCCFKKSYVGNLGSVTEKKIASGISAQHMLFSISDLGNYNYVIDQIIMRGISAQHHAVFKSEPRQS
jgi:hypothetical protein